MWTILYSCPGNFYPRSPCGERHRAPPYNLMIHQFLSTLSLRRATVGRVINHIKTYHFYPRSPCGERHTYSQHVTRPSGYFYPRSPCGERPNKLKEHVNEVLFLSTLSLRRATDTSSLMQCQAKFLSTLSLRRATHYDNYNLHCVEISIHALLAESDCRDKRNY